MELFLRPVEDRDLEQYMAWMQQAFQSGFESVFGKTQAEVLPKQDILRSLNAQGSAAYQAVVDGEPVGGVVVVIHPDTGHNHLDLLFVRDGVQARGIGLEIWRQVEALYPDTQVWETCTPYFDRRNIHFYVNKCGFHIVEFYNERHPELDAGPDFIGDGGLGMFVFRKEMDPENKRRNFHG